jgi:hypothetical protein
VERASRGKIHQLGLDGHTDQAQPGYAALVELNALAIAGLDRSSSLAGT